VKPETGGGVKEEAGGSGQGGKYARRLGGEEA